MHKIRRARISRELKASEKKFIAHMLSQLPNPVPYIEQLEHLRVVSQCDYGCPTIDLSLKENKNRSSEIPQILIGANGKSPEGIPVGIILWTKAGYISELEVYPWEDTINFGSPETRTLTNYGNRETGI